MKSVTTTEFREKIKHYLDEISEGSIVHLTKRGKVIAKVVPVEDIDSEELSAYRQRLKSYKSGGIQIQEDIVDQPLKDFDYIDDTLFDNSTIAAEPDDRYKKSNS